MSCLQAALDYARRGWSVFPLTPGTKRPAVLWSDYQYRRATEEEITAWWTVGWPAAGVAIVTGAISGLVVVDVDPRNGGDMGAAARDCPTDYAVHTGGGGLHLYCRHPGGSVPCGKTSRPGVDRKGDGGYVVAPPSLHESGSAYAVILAGELGELPGWVLDAPAPVPSAANPGGPWVADALGHPEGVLPGSQEETLTRLCWWAAGRRLDYDIAQAMLLSWVSRVPLGRPGEPWTVQHVDERLRRAYENRPAAPIRAELEQAAAPKADRPNLRTLALRTSEYCAQVHDEAAWIVPGLVARGASTELIGRVKEGKSTLLGTLAHAIAFGTDFLGRPATRGPVLWVSEQGGISMKATLVRAGLDKGEPDVWVLDRRALHGRDWRSACAEVAAIVQAGGAGVVFVDTLTALAAVGGESENQAGIIHEILAPMQAVLAAGAAVVYGRHANKHGQGNDPSTAARGSTAISGEMDVCVVLRPTGPDTRTLFVSGRLEEPFEVRVKYVKGDGGTGRYVLDDAPQDDAETLVLAALGAVPLSAAQIAVTLGLSRQTVAEHLESLYRTCRAVRLGTGHKGDPFKYRAFVQAQLEVAA